MRISVLLLAAALMTGFFHSSLGLAAEPCKHKKTVDGVELCCNTELLNDGTVEKVTCTNQPGWDASAGCGESIVGLWKSMTSYIEVNWSKGGTTCKLDDQGKQVMKGFDLQNQFFKKNKYTCKLVGDRYLWVSSCDLEGSWQKLDSFESKKCHFVPNSDGEPKHGRPGMTENWVNHHEKEPSPNLCK